LALREVKRRKLCVVTTTRADYGILHWLMREISEDSELELCVIATGTHLSTEFGMTVNAIESDGFRVDRRIEMLLSSDSETAIVKSIGVEIMSLADALGEIRPDFVVILGDRFEIVPVALASVIFGIPVVHIHGGETSQGSIDESFRHAVTKMASIHFPATEAYRNRILQMGEDPDLTFNLGAPGLDALYKLPLLDRRALAAALQFPLDGTVAIVTYHPVTTERGSAQQQIDDLLAAIETSGIRAVFSKANADLEGNLINQRLADFCSSKPARFRLFDNLGQTRYLSCLKSFDLMIGNSSSGLIEAPSFGLPVVNVGVRQKGRTRAGNVIDVGNDIEQVREGISRALSSSFKKSLEGLMNPYDRFGDGMTSRRIKNTLKQIPSSKSLAKKEFRDLV
jgi:UDP-N-acetylglucosamine 2-epimerase (non-hydrolysing)/GDP/UDP-N,N'-diacetylbacillosamine 2-epimerase (hydrolysing)